MNSEQLSWKSSGLPRCFCYPLVYGFPGHLWQTQVNIINNKYSQLKDYIYNVFHTWKNSRLMTLECRSYILNHLKFTVVPSLFKHSKARLMMHGNQ